MDSRDRVPVRKRDLRSRIAELAGAEAYPASEEVKPAKKNRKRLRTKDLTQRTLRTAQSHREFQSAGQRWQCRRLSATKPYVVTFLRFLRVLSILCGLCALFALCVKRFESLFGSRPWVIVRVRFCLSLTSSLFPVLSAGPSGAANLRRLAHGCGALRGWLRASWFTATIQRRSACALTICGLRLSRPSSFMAP